MKLSIVIPTYNEENNIPKLLEATHAALKAIGVSHELIVVDDRGKDRTREQVKSLQGSISEVMLIERDDERGLATALITGYSAARGEYLGAMDADLASDPKYLPEMIRVLDEGAFQFVIGSRYLPGSRFEGKPFLNRLASSVGQTVVKLLLGVRVRDTSNNFRLFKKEVWEKIKNDLHPDGNVMITEMVYLTEKNGFKIKEIPIDYIERREGESKLSIWKETKSFLKSILRIRFGR